MQRAVYVDSGPLGEGGVINDELPVDGDDVPLPPWDVFDEPDLVDLDDDLRAAFRARAVPQPRRVASDRQQLHDERRYDIPATVIAGDPEQGKTECQQDRAEQCAHAGRRIEQARPEGEAPQPTRAAGES